MLELVAKTNLRVRRIDEDTQSSVDKNFFVLNKRI